ncbi:hypothetical protein LRP31_33835 (plasmid) [Mesorhizobium mediterraneum]|uniref:Uncharacterized protein n=3 Tax=Mesorhizobium TaxID=68287 RepID=A0AB36RJS5_9HYPH|nr:MULTISPECIES: hypothetical protein [Mesorhizobium]PAQ04337.1 hypothetical protein CIT25_00060 [Mesorhizobium mediterraneum]RUU85190.1 hypothetical protein EOB59_32715 [Mesorhizobium sp. M7A.F.Ca.MR.176.00.0.0]RWA99597.1 MAG: hypothetical protein EOQ37_31325 [Mesorhizobium sp.]RWB09448.1 MAG: hypothetical protein EOQ39_33930 [Mesorhizobium sp.]RWN24237.1 MAG: hypothetical protein EOR95_33860 [Mesorhizobium sp.]
MARDIVAKDRHDRKYGMAVDTAGAIARALEKAYRQGFEDNRVGRPSQSQEPAAQDGPLDWALIPPRPRNAFWSICLFTLGRGESPSEMGYLAAATTERGTPGWRLVVPGLSYHDKSIGEKTIIPLVRLGLIEPALDEPHCLVVSTRGAQTWWLFHARGGRYPEDLTDV